MDLHYRTAVTVHLAALKIMECVVSSIMYTLNTDGKLCTHECYPHVEILDRVHYNNYYIFLAFYLAPNDRILTVQIIRASIR